jgi:hypothetical protein
MPLTSSEARDPVWWVICARVGVVELVTQCYELSLPSA